MPPGDSPTHGAAHARQRARPDEGAVLTSPRRRPVPTPAPGPSTAGPVLAAVPDSTATCEVGKAAPSPAQATAWFRGLLADGLDPTLWDDPALAGLLADAAALAGQGLSEHTLRSYGSAWSAWARWCAQHRLPPYPADPSHVALYAASLYTRPVPMRPVSVATRLTAINTAHRLLGLPEPATTGAALAVQRGGRRRHGTAPLLAKNALVLRELRLLLAAAGDSPDRRRDRAVVALHHAGLSPPALAALDWTHVTAQPDGTWHVTTADGAPPVVVAPIGGPGCPAAALAAARPPDGNGPVTRPTPSVLAGTARPVRATRPMTRQGVVQLLRRTHAAAGVAVPARGVPHRNPEDAGTVLTALAVPGPEELRDRSALLVGWTGALRRSGLAALNWDDFHDDSVTGETRVSVRRQKNDPDGTGHELWLIPHPDDPTLCPVTALTAWRTALTTLLNRDPAAAPGTPLLVRLTPSGRAALTPELHPERLSGDAVHRIVLKAAARAGRPAGAYGSHSLRSGWITEAAGTDGVTAFDIQQVSGHLQIESVLRYVRPVNARTRNPNRLIGRSQPASQRP